MAKRITDSDIQSRVDDLKKHGTDLGIEGAEYWAVENPYGPDGLHFLEVHHDDGRWVSQNTKLGTYHWPTKRAAYEGLTTLVHALWAAKNARPVSADELLGDGPEPGEFSARELYHRQSVWLRQNG